MSFFTKIWPFYLCAALFVTLFLLYMYLLDKPIAFQDGIAAVSDYSRETIRARSYHKPPPLNYATGLMLGLLAGGFIGGLCSGKFKIRFKSERAGVIPTALLCLAGGFLMMFGGLIAGDLFIGQLISALQLSSGAWLYLAFAFFTAMLITVFGFNASEQRSRPGEKPETGGKDGKDGAK